MVNLGWRVYQVMGLDLDDVEVILNKCLKGNKYFKLWNMRPSKNDLMERSLDWWEGKIAYYKYKG